MARGGGDALSAGNRNLEPGTLRQDTSAVVLVRPQGAMSKDAKKARLFHRYRGDDRNSRPDDGGSRPRYRVFGREKMDMVGMGPYLVHPDSPLAGYEGAWELKDDSRRLAVSLRMIALCRIYLHSVNIVSATALDVMAGESGRNSGIHYGANVIMPVFTPRREREAYEIYPGKADVGEIR